MRALVIVLALVGCKNSGDAADRSPAPEPTKAAPAPPPPPKKPAEPQVSNPCGADPCPCVAGTEVKTNAILVECQLDKTFGISGLMCGPGKATFNADDGALASCITDSMWALPYETPQDKDHVVMCGPGPITRRKTGGVASCVLFDVVRVGETTIAKGSVVTIDAKLAVTSATAPGGAKQCFDAAGKLEKCS